METQLRALLYNQFAERQVAFNPLEPEPFDLVDLTRDVTNATCIYHLRTECVREALEGASLIVTDNQPLADVVRHVLPRVRAIAIPFGAVNVVREVHEQPVVGLLNHSGEVEMNNTYALSLLKALERPLLIYGHSLPGLEAEVTEDFEQFAARCDILLLPSLPGAINSITLPLALMSAGVALIAHNAPGYYNLDAATGVQLLPNDADAWRWMLSNLESQPAKLNAMQERNRAFAVRLNRESLQRASMFIAQSALPRPPLSEGCGCTKKPRRGQRLTVSEPDDNPVQELAPTQPEQDQPNIEKEQ